jgi:hypothetical protein
MVETATADIIETMRVNLAVVFSCEPKDIEVDFTGFTDNSEWNYQLTEFFVGAQGPEFSGVRPCIMEDGKIPLEYIYEYMRGEEIHFDISELTLYA